MRTQTNENGLFRPQMCVQSGLLLVLAGTALSSGCSTRSKSATAEVFSPPAPYVRIACSDSNKVEFQIAARKFIPAHGKGPAVWMTGVSHIGESNYFTRVQQHLDEQTLVLFEGIGPSAGEEPHSRAAADPDRIQDPAGRKSKLSSLQSSLASSLGLVFQLEAIDYDRAHFQSSDLSVEELRALMAEAGAGENFEELLQTMQGGSWLDGILQITLRFLGTNPKLQGLSKLILVEVLGQIDGDPANLAGVPPHFKQLLEVLIARRNDKVMGDLEVELRRARRRDSISIFYGSGHMPDLETRMRKQLNYRPVDQIWFSAFSVDLARAGISESERQFIHALVKRQLEQLHTGPQ